MGVTGAFRIEIEAVGGHGCEREIPDGHEVFGCGRRGCPDCILRECISELHRRGSTVLTAKIVHWPGTPSEVVDDLVSRRRTGSFPPIR